MKHQWGPAIGEWRKFFEAVLRDIGEMTSQNRQNVNKPRNSMKELFEYLGIAGFFDADEQLGMRNTYRFLCSGAHPGIPEEHMARMAMMQALTSGQILVTKYLSWLRQRHGVNHGLKSSVSVATQLMTLWQAVEHALKAIGILHQ